MLQNLINSILVDGKMSNIMQPSLSQPGIKFSYVKYESLGKISSLPNTENNRLSDCCLVLTQLDIFWQIWTGILQFCSAIIAELPNIKLQNYWNYNFLGCWRHKLIMNPICDLPVYMTLFHCNQNISQSVHSSCLHVKSVIVQY